MRIGDRKIGGGEPPFVIAELSGNHNQSLDRGLELVERAAYAGADAIKLQTYRADTITIECDRPDFLIPEETESPWAGRSLYDLYEEAHTPWEWHEPIIRRTRELGMTWISSVFDSSSVEFLLELEVPAIKIASPELLDLPLIRCAANSGKPLIMSTGMATIDEIAQAVDAARSAGCRDLVLLKCTTSYPSRPENANVASIKYLADLFQCPAGISDHTLGIGVSVAAVSLGAAVVEKHLTINRADGGPDAGFSMEPEEFRGLVENCRFAHVAVGGVRFGVSDEEVSSLQGRRSLYVVCDMEEGDVLSSSNLRSIRPGFGLPPKHLDLLIGRRVNCSISRGTPMSWDFVLE